MKEYQYILTYNPYDGSSSSSLTLDVNPDGWEKLKITLGRHEVYHSVMRSFSTTLKFYNKTNGGFDFINNALGIDGIYTNIGIEIKKRNPNTNDYDNYLTGILDFTPEKYTIDENSIEVSIIDSSILQKFISRDENKIDLTATKSLDNTTITPPTLSTINLTPVDVVVKTKGKCTHNHIVDYFTNPGDDVQNYKWYLHDPVYTINQCTNINITGIDNIYENVDDETKIVSFSVDINYYIRVLCEASSSGNVVVKCTLKHYNSSKYPQSTDYVTLFTHPTINGLNAFTKTGSTSLSKTSISMISGDYLTLEFQVTSNLTNGSGAIYIEDDSTHGNNGYNFYIKEITPGLPTTTAKALFPFAAFEQAIEIITNNSNQLVSTIMNTGGALAKDAILNGYQIRKYPSPKVNITFKELFKSFDAIHNIGLGYNNSTNKFFIEDKSAFYDSATKIFDLGEVLNLKIQSYKDAYFSKIEGGYDNEGDYERVQGSLEFAVKREYSTVASVKETKEIHSAYRFDSVGIEESRNLQYISTASIDNNNDNNIFIVRTDGTDPILPNLGSPEYLGMDVFYSYYNTMLTPRQNAIRWGNILQLCHYKISNDLKAQETSKQFELEIDGVDENSDITIAELGTALFKPILYTFESYITSELFLLVLSNPHGYIDFKYNNLLYSGFIKEIEYEDYSGLANFKIIAKNDSIKYRITSDGYTRKTDSGTRILS